MSDFYALKVDAVERLTPNAVSVSFAVPDDLKEVFSFKAGQYITIKKELDGQELRRAYSISTPPSSGKLTVGVKKMPNGTFSNYANEEIKAGAILEVMPPEGRFKFEPDGSSKNIVAFAAGSGITPIMSIAHTVLESNNDNTFVLVFGNQSLEETMYSRELIELSKKYNEKFFLQSIYSREAEDGAMFGRIETSTVNFILKNKFKNVDFDAFYLCGPEEMIDIVKNKLIENGISEDKILFELFTATATEDELAQTLDGKTKVSVLVDDESFEITMDKKELVLDAVLKANIDAPYSCQGGVCSTCIARVTEGKVEMVKNQILTDGEIEEGLVLTCQSHPLTPNLKIDYDDV